MLKPRADRTITLPDSRRLAYAEWGDPEGHPVLFFHGTPSGRLFHHPDPGALDGLGVRWITVDRPGYGGSDYLPRRTLLGWAEDVAVLTERLSVERCSIVGLSGGGPHALACAYALPARVARTAVVSGVGRMTPEGLRQMHLERRVGVWLARRAPGLVAGLIRLVGDPRRVVDQYAKVVAQCPTDRAILERSEVREMLTAGWADANRQGVRAFAADSRVFALPWGFDVAEIRGTVRFWHGSADESIPLSMAQDLADAIPGATLEIVPGAGHFLFFDHFRQIVAWVAAV